MTRREFMRGTLAVGAAWAGSGLPGSSVLGANEDIRLAVVGINGRGGSHIDAFSKMQGVRLVALCDVDEKVLTERVQELDKQGLKVQTYTDIRKLLESPEIDAISVATPNHWHSLITIWACQAGKDVYVEKPCSHNVFEGRQCVEAARKHQRIVQHGTQNRASAEWAKQIAAIHSGRYGKLLVSKGYCCKPRWSIGTQPLQDPPQTLHFDLWLGPAPSQPYHANLVHYNWHWFWDFGNGDVGNQGVHQMDVARWAIKGGTLPKSVFSMGGRWVEDEGHKDQGQTPNMELCVYDYGDTLIVFETRGLVDKDPRYPKMVDNEFYLEAGTIKGGKFFPRGSEEPEPLVEVEYALQPNGIFGNFIDCVRSRRQDKLHADILEGHLSSALCHLGNISYRLGQEVPFRERPEIFEQNSVVSESAKMILANTEAIGVDPDQATYRVGPVLEFRPKHERFRDRKDANLMLTRPYRAPFVVPETV